jgi:hypothetical protein
MRIIDTPIAALGGRSSRELLLLGIVAYAVYLSVGFWPEFATATGVALLFAFRVPQARPIGVGFCLGWLVSMAAMTVANVRYYGAELHLANLYDLRFLIPAGLLALLSSRALFERFDAAPARFIPNVWRELPAKHWRMMRWSAYSLGVLSALIVPGWLWPTRAWGLSSTAATWIVIGIVLALALLVIGSALGFIVATLLSAFTLGKLAPLLSGSDYFSSGIRPGMIGPICGAALVVFLLSAPYCLRLFSGPRSELA